MKELTFCISSLSLSLVLRLSYNFASYFTVFIHVARYVNERRIELRNGDGKKVFNFILMVSKHSHNSLLRSVSRSLFHLFLWPMQTAGSFVFNCCYLLEINPQREKERKDERINEYTMNSRRCWRTMSFLNSWGNLFACTMSFPFHYYFFFFSAYFSSSFSSFVLKLHSLSSYEPYQIIAKFPRKSCRLIAKIWKSIRKMAAEISEDKTK